MDCSLHVLFPFALVLLKTGLTIILIWPGLFNFGFNCLLSFIPVLSQCCVCWYEYIHQFKFQVLMFAYNDNNVFIHSFIHSINAWNQTTASYSINFLLVHCHVFSCSGYCIPVYSTGPLLYCNITCLRRAQVTCSPRWRRRWAPPRGPSLTWVLSATAATGRRFSCAT